MNTRVVTALKFTPALVVFLAARQVHSTAAIHELGAPGSGDTVANAMNASGAVVGWYACANEPIRAVLWVQGVPRMLQTPRGAWSRANAINDHGVIAGAEGACPGGMHACLWQGRRLVQLCMAGERRSEARSVNGSGLAAGWVEIRGRHTACVWLNGRMLSLGTLSGASSEANAVNEQGEVAGWAQTAAGERHAFLWSHNRMRDLGTLGGLQSEATAVNCHGQVVGYADTASLARHAFRYENGAMADLDSRNDAAAESLATGINDSGQVVGNCGGLSVDGNDGGSAPFFTHGDQLDVLRTPRGARAGYGLQKVSAVTARGDIAATALSDGHTMAVAVTGE